MTQTITMLILIITSIPEKTENWNNDKFINKTNNTEHNIVKSSVCCYANKLKMNTTRHNQKSLIFEIMARLITKSTEN